MNASTFGSRLSAFAVPCPKAKAEGRKPKALLVLLAGACAGCALPVISAGTFLPAGDLKRGDLHASASMEMGRVLAGPSDVDGPATKTPQTARWEVSTWIASDASIRYALGDRIAVEAQLKLTNPIQPFAPNLVGGALGTRVRILDRRGDTGPAIEIGARGVGIFVDQELTLTRGQETQKDIWRYRALGIEVPVIATWRLNKLLALTGSPFLRAYWIRATHSVVSSAAEDDLLRLDWTPVLSLGVGLSAALQLGPVEVAPGFALELATRPGPGQATMLLFQPGLSVGTKF